MRKSFLIDCSRPLRVEKSDFDLDQHDNLKLRATIYNEGDKAVPGFIIWVHGMDSFGEGSRDFHESVYPGQAKQIQVQFRSNEWQGSDRVAVTVKVVND